SNPVWAKGMLPMEDADVHLRIQDHLWGYTRVQQHFQDIVPRSNHVQRIVVDPGSAVVGTPQIDPLRVQCPRSSGNVIKGIVLHTYFLAALILIVGSPDSLIASESCQIMTLGFVIDHFWH